MRHGAVVRGLLIGAGVLTATSFLVGCSGGKRSAASTLSQFIAAWDKGDVQTMTSLVYQPAPTFGSSVLGYASGLRATSATRAAGPISTTGSRATAPLTTTYFLPGMGPWKTTTQVELVEHSGTWQIAWSPSAVATGLADGQKLELVATWAPRAQILGAGGTPLTPQQPQVVVGVEGERIKDAASLTALLEAAGATAVQVSSALASATAHPSYFEPVITLSAQQYQALGGETGALYQAPGTVFQHTTSRGVITPGLAAHLVGSVGPITADELEKLGPPYTASSIVGQSGLEAADQTQLAGTPGGSVRIVGANGATVDTLQTFPATAGHDVTTSIDPAVQAAAEQALATTTGTAGLVAVRVSTGQVLASVSLPTSTPFDAALDGTFPPGSTFKILTSAALFQAGLTPSSPASCPPTDTVDGETFHNAEGDQPVSTIAQAFTESCNTAFTQLASSHLTASSFQTVASLFGLGQSFNMGYPATAGQVPPPADGAAVAATAIGQAGVVVSPLDMAAVAADVARGSVRPPRLVTGAPSDSATARPLAPTIDSDLKSMMAAVARSGTAAGTGLPTGTYAKTGTSQYGSGNPLPTDAWLVGWHGDVAFAMVVQDSKGNGGPVDGPIVARFLDALPASYT